LKILVIPDCQIKEGVPLEHLTWAGKAIVDYKPDVVVNIGDFADMPSLSTTSKVVSTLKVCATRRTLKLLRRP
jgi:hypothetical protein